MSWIDWNTRTLEPQHKIPLQELAFKKLTLFGVWHVLLRLQHHHKWCDIKRHTHIFVAGSTDHSLETFNYIYWWIFNISWSTNRGETVQWIWRQTLKLSSFEYELKWSLNVRHKSLLESILLPPVLTPLPPSVGQRLNIYTLQVFHTQRAVFKAEFYFFFLVALIFCCCQHFL